MSRTVPPYPQGKNVLAGKTAVITAAAGTGIGFWAARRFAEEGATLLVSDLHARRLDETADKLAELTGKRPATALCDVTNQQQVEALRDAAIAALGHVDVLVNNAGLGGTANLVDMTDAQWTKVLDVTLTGTMRVTRAFLPHMLGAERGAIVNNASVLGWRAQPGQSALRRGEGRRDGVHALRRDGGGRARACASTRSRRALAMHEFLSKMTPDGAARRAREARGLRPRRRALRGRERDGVPRERLRLLHDGRDRLGVEPAPLRRTRMRSLWIVLVALGSAAPAAALDLTGTWSEVRAACTTVADDGTRTKSNAVDFSDIEISESGAGLHLQFAGTGFIHEGFVLPVLPKNVGQGLVNRCLPGLPGVTTWQIQSATTFPPRNGVSGRLVMTFFDANSSAVEACRVTFERTNVANPAVPGCP